MKKTIFFIAAIAAALSVSAQIPNSGFETWNTVGSYEVPASWGTMNNTTASFSVFTATKGTPGSPGTSYLKLTSKSAGGSVVNGIAVSGKLDSLTLKPVSGFSFTQRPATFTGKWQHMIYGSSQGSVKVLTTRWNATSSTRDTVAHGEQTLSGMAMSWANFSINMNYLDSIHYPDSCVIVLQASGANPTNNDYLWVDNLAFTGTVAVVDVTPPNTVGLISENVNKLHFTLHPNPSRDYVMVSLKNVISQDLTVSLFDLTGRQLLSATINSDNTVKEIDLSALPQGIYVIRVSGPQFSETKKLLRE